MKTKYLISLVLIGIVCASVFGTNTNNLRVLNVEQRYLAPKKVAVFELVQENDQEANQSPNIPRALVFWNLEDQWGFYRNSLRLNKKQIDQIRRLQSFPSVVWKQLDRKQKYLFATYQARHKFVRATVSDGRRKSNLKTFLPQQARRLLNKVPVEVPLVRIIRLRDYLLSIPQLRRLATKSTPNYPMYPQCYSATLTFHGLERRPQLFISPEIILQTKSADDVQIDRFRKNGFKVLQVKSTDDLQFGDVITSYSVSHTLVYLLDNLVFEKPNDSGYSPWRIMKDDIQTNFLDAKDTFVLRKAK